MRKIITTLVVLGLCMLPTYATAAWTGRYKLVLIAYVQGTSTNQQVPPSPVSTLVLETFNSALDCQSAIGAELMFPLLSVAPVTSDLRAALLCSPSY
jgi:hypothetical protein